MCERCQWRVNDVRDVWWTSLTCNKCLMCDKRERYSKILKKFLFTERDNYYLRTNSKERCSLDCWLTWYSQTWNDFKTFCFSKCYETRHLFQRSVQFVCVLEIWSRGLSIRWSVQSDWLFVGVRVGGAWSVCTEVGVSRRTAGMVEGKERESNA